MSQDFKLKYDQILENQPGQPQLSPDDKLYPNTGYNRNIGFLWPSGNCEAFNYAYLVRLQFLPTENAIYMTFTTHIVKIEGNGLQALYFELFDQRNRIIECLEERYAAISDTKTFIKKITVTEAKSR
ncbi:hypothetical protein [Mucilaginibacter pedocola]|uniref:Uncharacterized protein n=1 Tax=Mucilaginibacter pedocola TaxID=1792845 RepID=A0A1S9P8Y1_9SPHI|nr:hypothetical protein [Mucilaginibacter pedocola]OOQ57402.1 hypothetical protein BC343_14990 [Mucilaginibacter pedocola]